MGHVFISYSHRDEHIADRMAARLQEAGTPVWKFNGPEKLPAGSELTEEVMARLRAASSYVLIYTQNSRESEWVAREFEFARRNRKTILIMRDLDADIDQVAFPGIADYVFADEFSGEPTNYNPLIQSTSIALREHCPVVAFMNAKGGVGKTTLAANLAGAMLRQDAERRILLLDLDPQYNLTQIFQSTPNLAKYHAADISVISLFEETQFHGRPTSPALTLRVASAPSMKKFHLDGLIQSAPEMIELVHYQLHIIYGQSEIIKYALSSNSVGKKNRREQFLRSVSLLRSEFDLIILDTNPGITFLAQCARDISDHIVTPILPDEFSLAGVRLLSMMDQFLTPPPVPPGRTLLLNYWPANPIGEQEAMVQAIKAGAYDEFLGPGLSETLLPHHVRESAHFALRGVGNVFSPLQRLVPFKPGRATGLPEAQENIAEVAAELWKRVKPHDQPEYAAPFPGNF